MEYEVKKPTDQTRIDVNNIGELLWWSYMLMVSPEDIVTAIEKVGSSPEQVKRSLKK